MKPGVLALAALFAVGAVAVSVRSEPPPGSRFQIGTNVLNLDVRVLPGTTLQVVTNGVANTFTSPLVFPRTTVILSNGVPIFVPQPAFDLRPKLEIHVPGPGPDPSVRYPLILPMNPPKVLDGMSWGELKRGTEFTYPTYPPRPVAPRQTPALLKP